MEKNLVKSTINTYETVLCEQLEQAIDGEFSLPDFCPDAVRILKCRAVPRICLKSASAKTVTVDGNVSVTVFYSDEDGGIFSYEYSYPFSKTKDVGQNIEEDRLIVKTKCDYINCRAVSGRKIDIHGAVKITITASRRNSIEVISDIDDDSIEVLKGVSPATTPSDYAEKSITIEEDCELSGGESGNSILRYDGDAYIKECKILSGKVILKGDMTVFVRYLKDSSVNTMKSVIPFSQVLDIKTPGDACECSGEVGICALEIAPKTDDDGEFRVFSVMAKLLLTAETYCKNDIPVILDAYSKKCGAEITKTPVKLKKLVDTISDGFTLKDEIKTADYSIQRIIDNWYDVRLSESKIAGNGIKVSGELLLSFIIKDEDENVSYIEKKADFEHTVPLAEKDGEFSADPKIMVKSLGYTLVDANTIEVRAELLVKTPLYEITEITAVTDIKICDDQASNGNSDTAMVVYFGQSGEKLWDIGRRYLSAVEDIKKINGIEEDTLSKDTTLLIPN
ncbi:MAG: DUF3794 domain-containing protein [Clostridia bacterium]|nr:DUF3794 domain-containing protein [Clostridia bacterium]